ncbi:MAG: hypothetical protein ACI4XG_19055, partial [Bradyrhizobium sp.]
AIHFRHAIPPLFVCFHLQIRPLNVRGPEPHIYEVQIVCMQNNESQYFVVLYDVATENCGPCGLAGAAADARIRPNERFVLRADGPE